MKKYFNQKKEKILYRDKFGNTLIAFNRNTWEVKNVKGKLITEKEFDKFMKKIGKLPVEGKAFKNVSFGGVF